MNEITTTIQTISLSDKESFDLEVKKSLNPVREQIGKLTETVNKIVINSNSDLETAESRLLDLRALEKMLIRKHKDIKSVLSPLVKSIDGEKKSIVDILVRLKETISSKITSYQTLAKSALAKELEDKLKEENIQKQVKLKQIQRIGNILSNMRAMIYGGIVVNKDGQFNKNGCFTVEDISKMRSILDRGVPPVTEFHTENHVAYHDMIGGITKMIEDRNKSIISGKNVNDGLDDSSASIIATSVEKNKKYESAISNSTRTIEKQLESTNKGFRKTINYKVFNEALISRELLCLDKEKMKIYLSENREKILKEMKDGHDGHYIDGIKFTVDMASIVR